MTSQLLDLLFRRYDKVLNLEPCPKWDQIAKIVTGVGKEMIKSIAIGRSSPFKFKENKTIKDGDISP